MSMKNVRYWFDKQNQLGYVSRWSIGKNLRMEDKVIDDTQWVIKYNVYTKDSTVDELLSQTAKESTFTSIAKNGSVAELYRAAEQVIKAAMETEDDWHIYIEGFNPQPDGSLLLVTGS